jgi:hypothetical protein
MITAIGIDPGKGASVLAAVQWSGVRGEPCVALRLAEVYGKWPDNWGARLDAAVFSFRDLAPGARVVYEKVPFTNRRDNPTDNTGPAEAAGCICTAWRIAYGKYPDPIAVRAWWAIAGVRAKTGDGRHRIAQASSRVQGAADLLAQVANKERQVDAAEAILIAMAGAYTAPRVGE